MKFFKLYLKIALVLAFAAVLPVCSFAATVEVRIEGISETYYVGCVEVSEGTTVSQILTDIDEADDSLTMVGIENAYITDINGDYASYFGGWDGWLFLLNGVDPVASIADVTVKDGDSVVLYFGDPFGVGMQFPYMTEGSESGVFVFMSDDTSYDENWNPVVLSNPVAGADVTVNGKTFVTDEKGEVNLSSALVGGSNTVFIERYTDVGGKLLPTVLRSSFEVEITPTNPDTADFAAYLPIALVLSGAFALLVKKNERN